jgi:hypothetical protein
VRTVVICVSLVMATSVSAACADSGSGSSDTAQNGTEDLTGLQLSLQVPDTVVSGDTVHFDLLLRNPFDSDLEFFTGVPPQEFRIADASGRQIWNSVSVESCGRDSPPAPSCRTIEGLRISAGKPFKLEAQQRVVFESAWGTTTSDGQQVAPGEYVVTGALVVSESGYGQEELVTPPSTITVLEN